MFYGANADILMDDVGWLVVYIAEWSYSQKND
jgi:hypothetical protein